MTARLGKRYLGFDLHVRRTCDAVLRPGHQKSPDAWTTPPDGTLEVDLDALQVEQHGTDEERHQLHEREWQRHFTAFAELDAKLHDPAAATARPRDPLLAELVRLRAQVEAMTPVVEAAARYLDAWNDPGAPMAPLRATVDAYRAGIGHRDVKPANVPTARVTPGTLTPAEWSALFDLAATERLRLTYAADEGGKRASLVSGIDKLRDVAYASIVDEDAQVALREMRDELGEYLSAAQRRVLDHLLGDGL